MLLTKIADAGWTKEIAEGGSGLTFAEFVSVAKEGLITFGLRDHVIERIRPSDSTPETLASLRGMLATNEASDEDIVLAYFNQGVLARDWDGPHISPIAAYNQESRQVLIMDVGREWYVPLLDDGHQAARGDAASGARAGPPCRRDRIKPASLPPGHQPR